MNANAQDFDPTNRGAASNLYQQQYPGSPSGAYGGGMQQHYNTAQESAGAYYDPSTGYQQDYNAAAYYPEQQQHDFNINAAGQWHNDAAPVLQDPVIVPGCYYPTVPNVLQPQLYGAPISAVAYDDEYEAVYVTSQTQSFGRNKRASMMATHSTLDGMLYSSCAAHPEASQKTLESIYQTFYRGGSSNPIAIEELRFHHVPINRFDQKISQACTRNMSWVSLHSCR
jgi:hypothetical protein